MNLTILTYPNPALKIVAEPTGAPYGDADWRMALVDDMINVAIQNDLVGLAATQVGINQQIFVVDMNSVDPKTVISKAELDVIPHKFRAFIDPDVIPDVYAGMVYGLEGCASVPNLIGKVNRYKKIHISYYSTSGFTLNELDVEGWLARIIQHENDHLNGILFTNRTHMTRRK